MDPITVMMALFAVYLIALIGGAPFRVLVGIAALDLIVIGFLLKVYG